MQRCMCGLKSPIRSEIKLGKSGVRHYQESRQQQERTLLTSSCTGIRERIRNGDKHGERHSQDMRNDLSSRLEQSGSSPRQTYHSSITTRSYLVAPTRAPPCPWGQVTGWEKKLQRTADLLLLQRKIYIRLGITMLSAVMLLYLAAGKVQHADWKACPDSALKHLLDFEHDPQATWLQDWADAPRWSQAQWGTLPSTALVLHWAALSWVHRKVKRPRAVSWYPEAGKLACRVTFSRSHNRSDEALQSHQYHKTPQPLLPLKCKCPSVTFLIY